MLSSISKSKSLVCKALFPQNIHTKEDSHVDVLSSGCNETTDVSLREAAKSLLAKQNNYIPSAKVVWTFDTKENGSYDPGVSCTSVGPDGTVYATARNGDGYDSLFSIDANGNKNWAKRFVDLSITSALCIGPDGTLYHGYEDIYHAAATLFTEYLIAKNPIGKEIWRFETGFYGGTCRDGEGTTIRSKPCVDSSGTVYAKTDEGSILAIDSTGHKKWSYNSGDTDNHPLCLGPDGTIYTGSDNGKLYAIKPNGWKKWKFNTKDFINSSPCVDSSGTVYVSGKSGKLWAIDENGYEKWMLKNEPSECTYLCVSNDGTLYAAGAGKLRAIDANGNEKWKMEAEGISKFSSLSVGSNGTVYVIGYNSTVRTISKDSEYLTRETENSKLYAINPDGKIKWALKNNGCALSSPSIGTNGTVYVGSSDGNVYALKNP